MNEKCTVIEMSFNLCNDKAIEMKLTLVQIKQTNKYYIAIFCAIL